MTILKTEAAVNSRDGKDLCLEADEVEPIKERL
ncbi:MAG: hypothetical protein JWQ71_188 [Pedosphaera sp.]|nr:hypothetical protein [Pedosphaera sp.]